MCIRDSPTPVSQQYNNDFTSTQIVHFYYKTRQVLQNKLFCLQNAAQHGKAYTFDDNSVRKSSRKTRSIKIQ